MRIQGQEGAKIQNDQIYFLPLKKSGNAAKSQKKYMRLLHFPPHTDVMLHVYQVLIEQKAPPCLIPPSQTFASFFPSPNHLSLLLIAKRQTTRMLGWDGFIMG